MEEELLFTELLPFRGLFSLTWQEWFCPQWHHRGLTFTTELFSALWLNFLCKWMWWYLGFLPSEDILLLWHWLSLGSPCQWLTWWWTLTGPWTPCPTWVSASAQDQRSPPRPPPPDQKQTPGSPLGLRGRLRLRSQTLVPSRPPGPTSDPPLPASYLDDVSPKVPNWQTNKKGVGTRLRTSKSNSTRYRF